MGKSQDLYRRAKKIIPGGTQLLSKRPEMFLPGKWPSYFKKASGCEVWDLDNNKYVDMCMAVGTNALGYANPAINKAVIRAIENGNTSTLNSYEEVQLAEKLIELHPRMEMARFARTGGEADAVAVRIARAASGKSKVAICGYHGWHDWYLAANLNKAGNLDNLLLAGLDPAGVPKELKGTTLPFHYGKIEELEKVVAENDREIGVIIAEVQRGREANIPFLQKVRKIADKINAVLIFDEVSSSFRLSTGALYKLYNLEPDMVVIGKSLGNGHPIAAILGKRNVMEAAQSSFISSSYWTERVGFAAALAVINQFEKRAVVAHLQKLGEQYNSGFAKIFKELKLKIDNVGMLPIPILNVQEENPLLFKTIFVQEMLGRGYLTSTFNYLTFAHDESHIRKYLATAHEVLSGMKRAGRGGGLGKLLKGPVCHAGFERLT